MSCDRHWKLLLGGFRSLVQGLYISKVKSKLCAQPILSFTASFCCENIVSFVLQLNLNTHTSLQSPDAVPSCAKWTVPFESLSVSMRPLSCSLAKYGNMSFPYSQGLQLISQLQQHSGPIVSAYRATLCLIIWFISEEEEEEELSESCLCSVLYSMSEWMMCCWLTIWIFVLCFFWILFISSCVFLLILPPVIGFLLFFVCPVLFSFTSVFCSS